MDRDKLRQYRSLKKEQKELEHKINKLYDKQADIPIVAGKVTGSSPNFPYIETRTTIEMIEPKKNDNLKRLIRAKENRKEMVEQSAIDIEKFIQRISDSMTRRIFELVFIDGMKQQEVADKLGYTKGRISQIISENLKD